MTMDRSNKFDLEVIRKNKMFDDDETNDLVKKRKHFTTLLGTQTKTLQDYLDYIAFERNFAKLVIQRKPAVPGPDIDELKTSILLRLKSIYDDAASYYPTNESLWMDYFKFCVYAKFSASDIDEVMNKMLKVHSDKPDVWLRYIDWNHNTAKNNVKSSIEIATQALRKAPRHELLHLELMNIVLSQLEQTSTAANVSVVQEASVIYENAFKQVPKLSMCLKMLEEATKHHPLAISLERSILSDMRLHYLREPLFWHSIAQRELNCQITYNSEERMQAVGRNPKLKYFACVDLYKTAVGLLKNNIMWTFYLDAMQMMQSYDDDHIQLKQRLLKEAYTSAESANRLTEPHYIHYINYLKENVNDPQELYDVISRAITAFPHATAIWLENMHHHIAHSDAKMVQQIFHQSKKKLGPHAYPIWKLYLTYIMKRLGGADECQDLVEKIVVEEHEFFGELKACCLEWVFGIRGIVEMRVFYKRVCVTGRPSLEFHQKMASLETEQATPDTNTWRQALEQIVKSYGRDRIDVWLDYVRFEQQHGNAEKIVDIATRARAALTLELADIFAYELGRFQANIV